jgi:hypothetical protein
MQELPLAARRSSTFASGSAGALPPEQPEQLACEVEARHEDRGDLVAVQDETSTGGHRRKEEGKSVARVVRVDGAPGETPLSSR